MSNKLIIFVAVVAAILGVLAGRLWQAPATPDVREATLLTPARTIAAFELERADGTAFDNASLRGRWTLAFFGFTHCPDVCPATLQLLAGVRERLLSESPEAATLSVVFVSIDPGRDSAADADRYARFFDPSFTGLSGTEAQVDAIATDLGILRLEIPQEEGRYTMDHTASVLLIDPQARLRAVFSPPFRPARMAADVAEIVDAA